MIEIKRKLFVFALLIANISCSQKKDVNVEYSTDMIMDKFLYNHFPETICTDEYTIRTNTNEERNNIAIFLKYKNCNKNKDSLVSELLNQSIVQYQLKEDCLLVINSTETNESLQNSGNVEEPLDFNSVECNYSAKIPIPNINMYFEGSAKDYDIYIFEAKKGEYSEFYKFSKNLLMPSYWNHGYSKGIAFSKTTNDIIYWGCMW